MEDVSMHGCVGVWILGHVDGLQTCDLMSK